MAGATISTLDSILKDLYLGPVVEQLNNEVLLLNRLESRDQELVGRQAIIPIHTSRTGGIGPAVEGGTLPTVSNQAYAKATYDLKYLYGIVQVTGPSMVKTKSEAGAFLRALESELDGLRNDLKKDLARQVYGPGTGVLATVSSSAGTTVHTLTSAEPILHGQLYVGMLIQAADTGFSTFRGSGAVFTITAVNASTPSITTAAISGITGTDVFIRQGAHSDSAGAVSATNNEIDAGLQKLVADTPTTGTVGAINRATAGNEYWRNQTLSVAPLTLDKLQQAWGTVRVAGGETSVMISSFGVQRQYYGLLQSQVRFNEPMSLKSGFQTLDFMGKPLVADVEAPFGKIYFLDERFIKVFSDRDWHFLDEDGLSLKWVSNKDAWQAVLARYMNLGISRANTHLVGTGLTDTTGV